EILSDHGRFVQQKDLIVIIHKIGTDSSFKCSVKKRQIPDKMIKPASGTPEEIDFIRRILHRLVVCSFGICKIFDRIIPQDLSSAFKILQGLFPYGIKVSQQKIRYNTVFSEELGTAVCTDHLAGRVV